MATDKTVRVSNLKTFLTKCVSIFVRKVDGKDLSTNDYTNAEKTKLAGIETGANKYTLPTASATTLGGVKVGSNLAISNGVLSAVQSTVDLTPYAKNADLATVAKSGEYSDLSGTPTKVSTFTNDAGYLTQHQSLANYYTKATADSTFAKKNRYYDRFPLSWQRRHLCRPAD